MAEHLHCTCTPGVTCPACVAFQAAPPRSPAQGPGPQLACCSAWQDITTLPHRCAQGGQVYLQHQR
jgi:hypothetical protein